MTFINHQPGAFTILCATGAGVLASVVPYVADVITLRRIPTSLLGVLMSINPVFAGLVGALALGEALGNVQWAGIFLIAAANGTHTL